MKEEQSMRKGLTEVVFILDRSGSMGGLESDTIGGFNSLINKQRKEEGEALISVVLFDDVTEVLYDRVEVQKVETMTDKQYYARGCTALLDAVGGAVKHISRVHKYIREEDRPEKTLFVITTDGMENASRKYSYQKVKELIRKREKDGWEFLFLGANIDAAAEAGKMGIRAGRALNYHADSAGTAANFAAVHETVRAYRACETVDAAAMDHIVEACCAPIVKDYARDRKRKK